MERKIMNKITIKSVFVIFIILVSVNCSGKGPGNSDEPTLTLLPYYLTQVDESRLSASLTVNDAGGLMVHEQNLFISDGVVRSDSFELENSKVYLFKIVFYYQDSEDNVLPVAYVLFSQTTSDSSLNITYLEDTVTYENNASANNELLPQFDYGIYEIPNLDTDGDGESNIFEILAGTDPIVANETNNNTNTDDEVCSIYYNLYYDQDEDGYGDSDVSVLSCSSHMLGYVNNGSDCDDDDATINPNKAWYEDQDGDGYGDRGSWVVGCEPPEGYVSDLTDCDDADLLVHPGVVEICFDGVDNNCDGSPNSCSVTGIFEVADISTKFFGEVEGDYAGWQVAGGDFDGNGVGDFIIGAIGDDTNGSGSGAVYLYYNGVSDDQLDLSLADTKILGSYQLDSLGESSVSAGDVNADGYEDLLVGAYKRSYNFDHAGAVYLFYGPIQNSQFVGEEEADAIFIGEDESDFAGGRVKGAGDVNGDGYDDILISAIGGKVYGIDLGKVYLIYGPIDSGIHYLSDANAIFVGESSSSYTGYSLSAGDVNGDGYSDIMIGGMYYDTNGNGSGSAYLIYGPIEDGNYDLANIDVKFRGESAEDIAGVDVSLAGDINGDGYDDVMIGAMYNDANGSNSGAAYLFYGPVSQGDFILSEANIKFVGAESSDYAGTALSTGADLNGDGFDDILIGALGINNNSGACYIFYGKSGEYDAVTNLSLADVVIHGENAADHFCAQGGVAYVPDFDGDGLDDLIIGAPYQDVDGDQAGAAYLVSLSPY